MAQSFNVLERTQKIHSSYILEASAGTGKTYSIENSVVRLLIDEKFPCTLDALLIVTFTNAATSDLKERIRRNLHKTVALLRSPISDDSFPDYLKALYEKGEVSLLYAKQKLEQALASFEQAPIFTIHKFCHRMLKEYLFEGDLGASLGPNEEGISPLLIYRLIKDFFRLDLHEGLITQGQLQRLLSRLNGFNGLEQELFNLVNRGIDIASVDSLQVLFQQFIAGITSLKNQGITEKAILEDFASQAPAYKNICDTQSRPKEENQVKVRKFAALFSKESWTLTDFDCLVADGLYLAEVFTPDNLKIKQKSRRGGELHFPDLLHKLNTLLLPTVTAARNPDYILCTLACKCKDLVTVYLDQKEIFGYDDLLTNMYKAVLQPEFAAKIRRRFAMAIIDEFQDTDPIQWEIFKRIFLPETGEHGRLYLVGDPKQSIYGFRQADIYTFLEASKILGPESKATLGVNYRSTKPFTEALNALFSSRTAPGLITLPRLKSTLPYQPVESGGLVEENSFQDNRGSIHFFVCEEKKQGKKSEKLQDCEERSFLPFIGKELISLQSQGISFGNCAVLVADRFQAMRLKSYLKALNIPAIAQHAESLSETLAFSSLRELLQALVNPQHESYLKIALGGPLLGWSHADILGLEDPYKLEPLIGKGITLRKIWHEAGFSACFCALLASTWLPSGKTVVETLLLRNGGIDIYHGIQQITELLIDKEAMEKLPPHRLLDLFEEIKLQEKEKDKGLKLRSNPEKEGVRILTIHSSKGLEFEIVFALGVINRSREPSLFIPVRQNQTAPLLTVVENHNDPRAIEYIQELDAEKIRQLYVAFTRAKQRLYIPLLFPSEGRVYERGTASPMELYLSLMGQPEIPFELLYDRIPLLNSLTSLAFLKGLADFQSISFSIVQPEELSSGLNAQVISEKFLKEPPQAIIVNPARYMHSFTALSMPGHQPATIVPNEIAPPNNFETYERSPHTLPAGSLTGTFLHTLLEKIPFQLVCASKEELVNFIKYYAERTPFEKWVEVLSDMLHNVLSFQFSMPNSSFCLQDIKESHCYREHEFTYATESTFHTEFESRPGYLKGVIDLLFIYQGKYYIIDWKTNWLGPDSSFYGQEKMKKAMLEHNYFLQAEIYKGALKRYLKLIDDRPFEDIFGATFYLFLRGIGPKNGTSGVYIC